MEDFVRSLNSMQTNETAFVNICSYQKLIRLINLNKVLSRVLKRLGMKPAE